jgi:hypothetical protein
MSLVFVWASQNSAPVSVAASAITGESVVTLSRDCPGKSSTTKTHRITLSKSRKKI